MSNIWYVEFPTSQYNEDVKALAAESGLKILDSKFDVGDGAKKTPSLTKIGEAKPKAKPKSKSKKAK